MRDRPADHQLELLLPETKHLSADLARIDAFLNDGRFIAVCSPLVVRLSPRV